MSDLQQDILLEVKKLEVVYGDLATAVQGVSFKVRRGDIVAILGVNGAGKTTTLRAISGFLHSDNADITDGTIEYQGMIINNKLPHENVKHGIVLIPERDKVFVTLTVEENLSACVATEQNEGQGLEIAFRYFPILKERRHIVAGYLSGGERQMLAIAEGLLCSPQLLMVDELSLGLAPVIVKHLMRIIRQLKKDLGLTLLMVEQNAVAALQIADYGYIMENGRVVFEGTKERLLSQEDIKEFYLGLGGGGSEKLKSYRDVKQYRRVRRWWA